MRKIEIKQWKNKDPEGKVTDEDFIMVLKLLLTSQTAEYTIKGIDKFRLFGRLSNAFENSEETKVLELEEGDYSFLKGLIEKEIPSKWGMKKEVLENVELFMDSKPEESK